MTAIPALEVDHLTRTFGSRGIHDLTLRVDAGDVYGFLGPNGAGKTTAMRCILGLIRKDAGEVRIFGESDPVRARAHVGALVESPAFHPWMSGRDNLLLATAYAGLSEQEGSREVNRVLERVGLTERGQERTSAYSLGMRQRLAIARTLIGQPRLLLLDEPTNGLDPKGMHEVRELVRSLAMHDGLTVFVSSHLLSEIQAIGTRVGILHEGRLKAEGRVDELIRTQKDRIEVTLTSTEPRRLHQALTDRPDTDVLDAYTPDETRVRVVSSDVSSLIEDLVKAGIPLTSVIPSNRSLEEVFLEVTG